MSAPVLVLASSNQGKLRELRELLRGKIEGLDVDTQVIDAATAGAGDVVEDAVTFQGNALKKAREIAAATGLVALADDSGISVDVLGGAPGSSRPAGPDATATTRRTSTCCWPSWATLPMSTVRQRSSAPPP